MRHMYITPETISEEVCISAASARWAKEKDQTLFHYHTYGDNCNQHEHKEYPADFYKKETETTTE